MNTIEPKIYVACLAAHNNGYLHGDWIDAHRTVDELYEDIRKILASSPIAAAEEWGIFDFEGFGDMHINEYAGLDTVAALAEFVVEHGELGAAVLAHVNGDIEEAQRILEECYHGEYDSEEDFAASFAEDIMSIPAHLEYYIDYEKMARDWFISDFFSLVINHRTHVFSNS